MTITTGFSVSGPARLPALQRPSLFCREVRQDGYMAAGSSVSGTWKGRSEAECAKPDPGW